MPLLKPQIAHFKLEILSSGKHYCYMNMTRIPRFEAGLCENCLVFWTSSLAKARDDTTVFL